MAKDLSGKQRVSSYGLASSSLFSSLFRGTQKQEHKPFAKPKIRPNKLVFVGPERSGKSTLIKRSYHLKTFYFIAESHVDLQLMWSAETLKRQERYWIAAVHTCLIRSAVRFGEALVASSSDLLTPSTVSSISQLRALVSTFENVMMDEYWEAQSTEEGFAKSDRTALDDISTHCIVFEGNDSICQHKVGLSSRKNTNHEELVSFGHSLTQLLPSHLRSATP